MRRFGRGSPSREGWPCGCRRYCPASGRRRPVGLEHRPRHGSCWSRPHARCRPLPARPPFYGLGRAVRLHMRAIQGQLLGHGAGGCHLLEHALPDAARGPAREAVVDGGGWPIRSRHIPSSAPCLEDVQDAGDHPPVIHARLARETPSRCGPMAAQASSDSQNRCAMTLLLPPNPFRQENSSQSQTSIWVPHLALQLHS